MRIMSVLAFFLAACGGKPSTEAPDATTDRNAEVCCHTKEAGDDGKAVDKYVRITLDACESTGFDPVDDGKCAAAENSSAASSGRSGKGRRGRQ